MEHLTAALAGALIALGAVLVTAGIRRTTRSPGLPMKLWRRPAELWTTMSTRRRVWVVGSLAAGVVVALATGWVIAIIILPAGLLGIPTLLAEPPQREVELLAGLDRWVRLLAPSIATGKSIRDAIIATRAQVAPTLKVPVTRLVSRIDQGWSTHDALLAMADDLGSADGDAVLAALAIASSRGGAGTRSTLGALADNTQDRLRALRQIAAERAKPRAVVRQVTIITLAVLGGSMLLGGNFFDPYRSPLGQILALGLAAAYVGALVMLRRRTTPPPAARFLRGAA